MVLYLAPRGKERGLEWFGLAWFNKPRGVFVVKKNIVRGPLRGSGVVDLPPPHRQAFFSTPANVPRLLRKN